MRSSTGTSLPSYYVALPIQILSITWAAQVMISCIGDQCSVQTAHSSLSVCKKLIVALRRARSSPKLLITESSPTLFDL